MAYNPPANNAVNFVLKSYTAPANNAVSFSLDGAVVALTLDDFAFSAIVPGNTQVTLIPRLVLDDFAFAALIPEAMELVVDVIVLDDFIFTPLNLGGTLIIEEGYMSVTLANGGVVYKMTAADDTLSGDLFVKRIRWVGATTPSHAVEVRTYPYATSDTIYADVASVANYVGELDFSDHPLRIGGLKLHSINSGTVYVYIR